MDWVQQFFTSNFAGCVWLACILLSAIPLLESKIAIPFAMNPAFFGSNALSGVAAYFCSLAGSLLPCIFVVVLVRYIKNKTSVIFINSKKFAVKINKLNSQTSTLKKYVLLASFVAIPLPLTGVWTGSVIAGLSTLRLPYCLLAICVGAAISCAITTLVCSVFANSTGIVLFISLAMVVAFLLVDIVMSLLKRK